MTAHVNNKRTEPEESPDVKTILRRLAHEEGNPFISDNFEILNEHFGGSDTIYMKLIIGSVINEDKVNRMNKVLGQYDLKISTWQILETDTKNGRLSIRLFIGKIKRRVK